jgi:DNA polymerase III epsilon subunit-like protein
VLFCLDAADRLVGIIEGGGDLPFDRAAQILLALAGPPTALARSLTDEVVRGDARLVRRGDAVGLAPAPAADVLLDQARFVVVDVETTGFRPGKARITEVGAVVLERDRLGARFEAGGDEVGPLLEFASGGVLAGHNIRFDLGFLDEGLRRSISARVAAPLVDTLVLARRLLNGRTERSSLGALAEFFGTDHRPCHRALPDALATAEVLSRLLPLAGELGARTVGDLCGLSRPRLTGPVRARR